MMHCGVWFTRVGYLGRLLQGKTGYNRVNWVAV